MVGDTQNAAVPDEFQHLFNPCPACGGQAEDYDCTFDRDSVPVGYDVHCGNEGCEFSVTLPVSADKYYPTFSPLARDWNVAVAAYTKASVAVAAPVVVTEPRVNSRLSDADVAALLGAKRHLAAGYEVLNWYASGQDRKDKLGGEDANGVMAEAYARMAPAVAFVNEVLEGVDIKTVMSRLTDYISLELAEQRDDLDSTRENLYKEVEEKNSDFFDRVEAWEAEERSREHAFEQRVEAEVERRVAEILADRSAAATVIRRGKTRKVVVN